MLATPSQTARRISTALVHQGLLDSGEFSNLFEQSCVALANELVGLNPEQAIRTASRRFHDAATIGVVGNYPSHYFDRFNLEAPEIPCKDLAGLHYGCLDGGEYPNPVHVVQYGLHQVVVVRTNTWAYTDQADRESIFGTVHLNSCFGILLEEGNKRLLAHAVMMKRDALYELYQQYRDNFSENARPYLICPVVDDNASGGLRALVSFGDQFVAQHPEFRKLPYPIGDVDHATSSVLHYKGMLCTVSVEKWQEGRHQPDFLSRLLDESAVIQSS